MEGGKRKKEEKREAKQRACGTRRSCQAQACLGLCERTATVSLNSPSTLCSLVSSSPLTPHFQQTFPKHSPPGLLHSQGDSDVHTVYKATCTRALPQLPLLFQANLGSSPSYLHLIIQLSPTHSTPCSQPEPSRGIPRV
jgi:hypothetical protein